MATDFGRDISCTTGLRSGRFASGIMLVAEAAYRRLTTPRGMLRGGEAEENYGIDLTALIGRLSTKAVIASLPDRIRAELTKDERILTVETTIVETTAGEGLRSFEITIDAVTMEGPFSLQVVASDVTTELLGIEIEEAA